MTRTPSERSGRLLRWYPPAWRKRYAHEFAAVLDDQLGEAAPSVRLRLDVIRAGLTQRLREAGVMGDGAPSSEGIRGGALVVLCAWAIFVVAGIGLVKVAEHWQQSVSGEERTRAAIAFGAVQTIAAVAGLLVIAGAVAVMPAFLRSLRAGAWPAIRRRALWAVAVCGWTAIVLGITAWWAHRLTEAQRNGSDLGFALVGLLLAVSVTASIASITAAGVAAVRHTELPANVLQLEGRLAQAVAVAMVLMAVAAGVWWTVMAVSAPWFFSNTGTVGSHGSPLNPATALTGLFMLVAVVLGILGAGRVAQGLRGSRT
jgi:hypothetical protein